MPSPFPVELQGCFAFLIMESEKGREAARCLRVSPAFSQ